MINKTWNWLQKQWPHFSYDKEALRELEYEFSQNTGTVLGLLKHVHYASNKLRRCEKDCYGCYGNYCFGLAVIIYEMRILWIGNRNNSSNRGHMERPITLDVGKNGCYGNYCF
jgi:uncharacterized protein DUF4172